MKSAILSLEKMPTLRMAINSPTYFVEFRKGRLSLTSVSFLFLLQRAPVVILCQSYTLFNNVTRDNYFKQQPNNDSCRTITLKSSMYCDITLSIPLKDNRRFGGTFRLHLQCQRISYARKQFEEVSEEGALLQRLH
jgi:hypothetical protein